MQQGSRNIAASGEIFIISNNKKSPSSPMGRKTRDSHPISPLRHRIGLFKSKQTLIL